jgi:hypothetical protein
MRGCISAHRFDKCVLEFQEQTMLLLSSLLLLLQLHKGNAEEESNCLRNRRKLAPAVPSIEAARLRYPGSSSDTARRHALGRAVRLEVLQRSCAVCLLVLPVLLIQSPRCIDSFLDLQLSRGVAAGTMSRTTVDRGRALERRTGMFLPSTPPAPRPRSPGYNCLYHGRGTTFLTIDPD